jgi:hypothetical protein
MRTQGDAATACARQRRAFEGAVLLVRVYYAATLYVVALQVPDWRKWSEAAALAPRWPVAWIELIGVRPGVHLVMSFALAATLAAAVAPESRRARVLAAVALLELVALYYSFGSIGSGWTLWLWTAFLFVLLPDGNAASAATARARRQRHLTVFWAAQVMLFGSFALSGAWKIVYAVVQISAGEVHAFAPNALARHVAKQLLSSGETSLLGPAVIENPILGWMPFLAVMYVELGAIAAAFRPSLHRVWAVALIAFHLATTLVLAMTFPRSVLLLAILCAPSPFAPAQMRWWTVAYELPLLGAALHRIRRGGARNLRKSAGSRAAHEAN